MSKSKEGLPVDDPMYLAAVDLIGRTGAQDYQVRYQDDLEPVVWVAVAIYPGRAEAAAALEPAMATYRLCAQLVEGGMCAHCLRAAGFDWNFGAMPLNQLVCWYQYDPELKTFRRGCEGS